METQETGKEKRLTRKERVFHQLSELTCKVTLDDIRSVLVVRMQVPCCGGLTHAVETALAASGRDIPLRVVILTPSGEEVA